MSNFISITPEPLDVGATFQLATDPGCGAVSLFVGTTRDNFEGKRVERLEYEAYESMAEKELQKLCARLRDKWPSLRHIVVHHRTGVVAVAEASVVLAVSSPHRADSLQAVHFLIDELKRTVPIWKKEKYAGPAADQAEWKQNKECEWAEKNDKKTDAIKDEDIDVGSDVDPSLVQIVAPKAEIDRRISAFIQRKREEINTANVLEFCNRHVSERSDFSCARTDSVVYRRKDSASHLRHSQVVNPDGPQTKRENEDGPVQYDRMKRIKTEDGGEEAARCVKEEEEESVPVGVAERLRPLEQKLLLLPNRPVPKDIYARLKALEDRLKYLEGVSPEYFEQVLAGRKIKEEEQGEGEERRWMKGMKSTVASTEYSEAVSKSLSSINNRIHELQASLKIKTEPA